MSIYDRSTMKLEQFETIKRDGREKPEIDMTPVWVALRQLPVGAELAVFITNRQHHKRLYNAAHEKRCRQRHNLTFRDTILHCRAEWGGAVILKRERVTEGMRRTPQIFKSYPRKADYLWENKGRCTCTLGPTGHVLINPACPTLPRGKDGEVLVDALKEE